MDKSDGLSDFDGTVARMSSSPNESADGHESAQHREPASGAEPEQSPPSAALLVGPPIDVVAALRAAAVPKPSPRAWGWWALAAVGVFISVVLAAGLVAVVTGSASQRRPSAVSARPVVASPTLRPTASPTPSGRAATAEWRSVVAALDDARAAAFARAEVSMLAAFDAPGSSAYLADLAAVTAMKSHGVRADGFVLDVAAVRVRAATNETAQLFVTDARPAFRWRTQSDALMASVPPRQRVTWLVNLIRGGALGWQVVSVRAATDSAQRPTSQQWSGR